jgi:SAM-dependent methyltransferase
MNMNEVKYVHTEEVHNLQSAKAFLPILKKFITPSSVLDVGCGTGTWLKVFKDFGAETVLGIDGPNVDPKGLVIDESEFLTHDLRDKLNLKKKFDLAVCLEVAEHLPHQTADMIIDLLVSHADTILFSAALKFQGGQNHINEQPFNYWVKKFNEKGFIVNDFFRPCIWNNSKIEWWYRQNMFLVTKQKDQAQEIIYDYYHPDLYIQNTKKLNGHQQTVESYRGALESYKATCESLEVFEEKYWNMLSGKISVLQAVKILYRSFKNFFSPQATTGS